jgi:hypothetical protein
MPRENSPHPGVPTLDAGEKKFNSRLVAPSILVIHPFSRRRTCVPRARLTRSDETLHTNSHSEQSAQAWHFGSKKTRHDLALEMTETRTKNKDYQLVISKSLSAGTRALSSPELDR